jgi:hypothetical protein
MGKLAELAKAKTLKGKVMITRADGTSRTYATEAEAEKAAATLDLEHRRGAFFEKPKAAPAPVVDAEVSAPAPAAPPAAKTKKTT